MLKQELTLPKNRVLKIEGTDLVLEREGVKLPIYLGANKLEGIIQTGSKIFIIVEGGFPLWLKTDEMLCYLL